MTLPEGEVGRAGVRDRQAVDQGAAGAGPWSSRPEPAEPEPSAHDGDAGAPPGFSNVVDAVQTAASTRGRICSIPGGGRQDDCGARLGASLR